MTFTKINRGPFAEPHWKFTCPGCGYTTNTMTRDGAEGVQRMHIGAHSIARETQR